MCLGAKIFCERITLFSYIIVRNGVRTGVRVPTRSLTYRIPLFLRSTMLYARESCAIRERPIADGRYVIGDHHAREAGAITERILADGRYAIGGHHAREAGAITERIRAD